MEPGRCWCRAFWPLPFTAGVVNRPPQGSLCFCGKQALGGHCWARGHTGWHAGCCEVQMICPVPGQNRDSRGLGGKRPRALPQVPAQVRSAPGQPRAMIQPRGASVWPEGSCRAECAPRGCERFTCRLKLVKRGTPQAAQETARATEGCTGKRAGSGFPP